MTKYLLCRPQGGLTDQLCQIGRCMQYAEKYHRSLIIDNAFHNFLGMSDDLSRYFSCSNENIQLNLPANFKLEKIASIFPVIPIGNIHSYPYYFSRVTGETFFDIGRLNPITFDFSKDYQEELLIHHRPGDGPELALYALSKFKLNHHIANEVLRRHRLIGNDYEAMHIRNTDVSTDFISAFSQIKQINPEKLFIATDSYTVLRIAKKYFGEKAFFYSEIPYINDQPLHINIDPQSVYSRYQGAICDLLLLGLASKLHIFKVKPGKNKIYSGFSELGFLLNQNKAVIQNLLSLA